MQTARAEEGREEDTRPRWERRKEARPAELLAAALELFVERGYAGTRLDDVAARAGVSKGTLYLYFATKEDLFKAVVRENIVTLIAAKADAVAAYRGDSAALLADLVTSWWRDFGSTRAGGISKLIMAESGNFPEIARFFLDEVIAPWHRLLGMAIERGIAHGEFRAVDVPTFVQVMTAPMVMLSLWKNSFGACSRQPIDPAQYIATVLDTTLAALHAGVAPQAAVAGPSGSVTKRTNRGVKRGRRE